MKQPVLNINFDSFFSSPCGNELFINNFPLDCLVPAFESFICPVVVIVPDIDFELAIKYLEQLGNKAPPLIPPTADVFKEPAFLDFSKKQFMNKAKELFVFGVKNINFILCAKSGLHAHIVGSNKDKSLYLDNKLTFEICLEFLQENEYCLVDMTSAKGEYSIRGGIIDFFPRSRENPIRLSFLGDNLAIHSFDVNSQHTIKPIYGNFSIPSINSSALSSIYSFLKVKYNFIYINDGNRKKNECYVDFLKQYTVFNSQEIQNKSFNKKVSHPFLSSSCILDDKGILFVPSRVLNKKFVPVSSVPENISTHLNISTIKKGDFLVHRDHGVGRFLGLCINDEGSYPGECILLEYGNGEKIKIDVSRLDLITFFANKLAENIVLDSLSKKNIWKRKRSAAQRAAEGTVENILNLYVKRAETARPPFIKQGAFEDVFLNDFPFTPTKDQTTAWKEISQDMSAKIPMDRLLCGDVGFGKTELAMRAAFRCVLCNLRVVVLAPTTLLANQLYVSFKNRLSSHGASVDLVSRFRSKKDIILIKNNILNKKNDVLVGTHSLLSDDVYVNNIGLLIIDEEHRFGVSQKEKIKQCKNNIDVLSMSATPIPRSMNLAVSGIYSISLLQTPPLLRLPIKTSIKTFNDKTIIDAITFEVERGGQVFCVNNDVKSINALADRLRRCLPLLTIKILHGQEPSKKIEANMEQFIAKKTDVLVCTSIIEAGIDVPNANCIIINNAHMFGLAQLYQMRGRVGRSNQQAYAYLFLPNGYSPSEQAVGRLNSIKKNTKLGSGLNISQADLEIRGGGSLFGYKQSGGGSSVGYEMYIKLIQRALHSAKSLNVDFKVLPEDVIIKIYSNTYISEKYISSENLRLSAYKEFLSSSSIKDLNLLIENIMDRFGPPPPSFLSLINECRLKILSSKAGFTSIAKQGCGVVLNYMSIDNNNYISALVDFINKFFSKHSLDFHFMPTQNLSFCVHFKKGADKHLLLSNFLNKFILFN